MKKYLSKHKTIIGISIFIISLIFWALFFSLPFMNYQLKVKLKLGTFYLIMGEILFYLSTFILGRELYLKYKTRLNPRYWFKKRNKDVKLEVTHKSEEETLNFNNNQ